jgi:hypothetical protein
LRNHLAGAIRIVHLEKYKKGIFREKTGAARIYEKN